MQPVEFTGNKALPTSELRQQFHIHDTAVFNVEKIRQGLENLRKLSASNGYLNFVPVPNTEADDTFGVVKLRIDIDEGKQFYLAGLLLDAEAPHAGDAAKLLEAWKPMQGEVYDGSKIDEWWQLAATMLPPGAQLEQLLELRQDARTRMLQHCSTFRRGKNSAYFPFVRYALIIASHLGPLWASAWAMRRTCWLASGRRAVRS